MYWTTSQPTGQPSQGRAGLSCLNWNSWALGTHLLKGMTCRVSVCSGLMVTKSWGYFLSETLQFLPLPASWERVQSVVASPATGPRPPTASDWQAGAETVESDGVSRIQITNNFRKQQEQPIFQKRKVNKKLLAATPRRAGSHLHDQGLGLADLHMQRPCERQRQTQDCCLGWGL